MYNTNKSYLLKTFSIFFLIGIFVTQGKSQVTILFKSWSPYNVTIRDLLNVRIINNEPGSHQVYIKTWVEGPSRLLEIQTAPKIIDPGINLFAYNQFHIDRQVFYDSRFRNVVNATGNLPSGEYIICTEVYSLISRKALDNFCLEKSVNIQNPPRLSYPAARQTINTQKPVFNWIPPTPILVNSNVKYKIQINEVLEGQSPEEAILQNSPFLIRSGLNSNIYPYEFGDPVLQKDEIYAWQVIAYSNEFEIGKSQVWQFDVRRNNTEENKTANFSASHPKQGYHIIKREVNGDYCVVDKDLSFTFNENKHVKILRFHFLNDASEDITPIDLNLHQSYGENYYTVKLSDYEVFEPGEIYMLKLNGQDKVNYYLKFKYNE